MFREKKTVFVLTMLYFAATFLCIVAEFFEWKMLLTVFKPLIIPSLIGMYWFTSRQRNYFYLFCLLLALVSNIFLLSKTNSALFCSNLAIITSRFIMMVLVVRLIGKVLIVPFLIATLPFLFIFACLINLTITLDSPVFLAALLNAVFLSVIAGIALSAYMMDDNKANSWLAISTLLFIVLTFLFMIQKFYLANLVFQPMSAFVFAFAHFAFFRFMIESENRLHHDRTV